MAYLAEALDRVRSAPGIQRAGLTDVLPMGFNRLWSMDGPGIEGPREGRPPAFVRVVSEGYLGTMGVSLRSGRDFDASDDSRGRSVVIVNESLARRLWPGRDPIGQLLDPGGFGFNREVIGVVKGLRYQSLEKESGDDMYIPMRQTMDFDAVYVIARGPAPSAALVSAVR